MQGPLVKSLLSLHYRHASEFGNALALLLQPTAFVLWPRYNTIEENGTRGLLFLNHLLILLIRRLQKADKTIRKKKVAKMEGEAKEDIEEKNGKKREGEKDKTDNKRRRRRKRRSRMLRRPSGAGKKSCGSLEEGISAPSPLLGDVPPAAL